MAEPVTVALFPGQGSLTPAAREAVAEHRPDLLERVCALVGEDPFERAGESTRFAQPAIFCASLAGWGSVDQRELLAVTGHSLGELTALAAAGALDEGDALELVVLRGRLMDEAAAGGAPGGMLAVLGSTPEAAGDLAAEHGVAVANDNAPGQVVLSGDRDRLKEAARAARERGVRTMRLDVAGAFHSPAMAPAETPFLDVLRTVDVHEPRIPVCSSSSPGLFADVPLQLARALTRPVRFRETVEALHRFGATRFVDVGPGDVLARLVTRILPAATVVTLEDLHGLAA
ncbi:MAG: ACP S-malonyltransferase [Solirubrobacterales bacterium]|nr:ACP S-malonyltransferase [Solirubrobacterales bacterium]